MCPVLATGKDHCFHHGGESEVILVTCTFNVTSGAVCPIPRKDPQFEVFVKSETVYITCSNTSTLNIGSCTCKGSYAGNSTCTLTLNTTQLERRRVVWKFCSQQEIDLNVDNNSTSKRTPISDQMPATDVSVNIAGAVTGAVAGAVAIVTIFIVLLLKKRGLLTGETISSNGEDVALSSVRH